MKQDGVKVGRNDPCPCGSGKKFKRCHLGRDVAWVPSTVLGAQRAVQATREAANREARRIDLFGYGRPVIADRIKDTSFVAVGNTLRYSPQWRTFPDFLNGYARHVLGDEWASREFRKPVEQRHPLIRLYERTLTRWNNLEPDEDGICRSVPSGPQLAWLTVAYDLYALDHNHGLQSELVRRLKDRLGYQGARHELFAVATMIRAGFSIQFENERDGSRRHVEFFATDRFGSGQHPERIAVEAKSRRRRGVYAEGGVHNVNETKAGVRDLLEDAYAKRPKLPYVIFVDLNLPPTAPAAQWMREIADDIGDRQLAFPDEPEPFTLIVCTNHPLHYGADDEDRPPLATVSALARNPEIPFRDMWSMSNRIQDAAEKFGNVPNEIDGLNAGT